ncbi:MAG: hypothetical protein NZ700_17050, partial [Gemmataceae bacterium]|nr:hypothetical protein [Gemmataceae bacterium]MDW8264109.1 hypothetical protein [Gemmataceae bacterium]
GGSLVGASVGGVVWASRTFQGRFISPYQATGADAAAQQWRTMKNWLASWAAIGMVIGASAGAAWAGRWLGNTPAELTFPWAFAGALGGVAVLSGLRLAARRPPDDEAASRP